jgi:hypothetical protein
MMPTTPLPAPLAAVSVVAALLYIATALRFVWYRPNGARHRRMVSLLASALIAAMLCRAVDILVCRSAVSLPEAVVIAVQLAAACAARGNLAELLKRRTHA